MRHLIQGSRFRIYGKKILLFVFFVGMIHYFQLPAEAAQISSKAAIVIDGDRDRVLYAKNPHMRLMPASTTKLVTAMVALDILAPDTVFVMSGSAAGVQSVQPHLKAGEKISVKDLLYLSLMKSVNSAAVALAEAASGSEDEFVQLMNKKAAQLGAENTRFINASGLPGKGQHITAYDLAIIMSHSLKYPLIREIINTRAAEVSTIEGQHLFVTNTNQMLWEDSDIIGGKTGYTRSARHCFTGAARKGDRTIITAVLGSRSRASLWNDVEALLSKGDEVLTRHGNPMIQYDENEETVILAGYNPAGASKYKGSVSRGKSGGAAAYKSPKKMKKSKKSLKAGVKKKGVSPSVHKGKSSKRIA
ncbi:MAG: D-alanyl-D-alanine carboxypeptidase [Nitrospirae bacterium]|nr:D-alanyl-D-alanine carboxypeptidase [Nitrospirota bacterium]